MFIQRSTLQLSLIHISRTFVQPSNLSKHKLIIHAGIKKYQCDICEKTFTYAYQLKTHKELHPGIKKYQ